MIRVYFDYPTATKQGVNIHSPACSGFRRMDGSPARKIYLTRETFTDQLRQLAGSAYTFGNDPAHTSLWIQIDLGSEKAERDAARLIKGLLGQRYRPFARAELRDCECDTG